MSLSYNKTHELLWSGMNDGHIRGWNIKMAAGKLTIKTQADFDEDLGYRNKITLKAAHRGPVIALDNLDNQLISGGGDGVLKVYNEDIQVETILKNEKSNQSIKDIKFHEKNSILSCTA